MAKGVSIKVVLRVAWADGHTPTELRLFLHKGCPLGYISENCNTPFSVSCPLGYVRTLKNYKLLLSTLDLFSNDHCIVVK